MLIEPSSQEPIHLTCPLCCSEVRRPDAVDEKKLTSLALGELIPTLLHDLRREMPGIQGHIELLRMFLLQTEVPKNVLAHLEGVEQVLENSYRVLERFSRPNDALIAVAGIRTLHANLDRQLQISSQLDIAQVEDQSLRIDGGKFFQFLRVLFLELLKTMRRTRSFQVMITYAVRENVLFGDAEITYAGELERDQFDANLVRLTAAVFDGTVVVSCVTEIVRVRWTFPTHQ